VAVPEASLDALQATLATPTLSLAVPLTTIELADIENVLLAGDTIVSEGGVVSGAPGDGGGRRIGRRRGGPLPGYRYALGDDVLRGIFSNDRDDVRAHVERYGRNRPGCGCWNGSVNSSSNPARRGSIVTFYATGQGSSPAVIGLTVGKYRQMCFTLVPRPDSPA